LGLRRRAKSEGISDTEVLHALFALAANAHDPRPVAIAEIERIVGVFKAPAIRWLVTLWHEQRHFIDHLFTNYGASQFRVGFMLRSQLETILMSAASVGKMIFPIDVYGDEVDLESFGVKTDGPHPLSPIANFIAERRQMLVDDKTIGSTPSGQFPMDGYTFLEALGSIAQLKRMMSVLGKSAYAQQWEQLGQAYTRFPYLTAVTKRLESAGIRVLDLRPIDHDSAFLGINDSLLGPLLIASLMCRRLKTSDAIEISEFLPASRFNNLVDKVADVRGVSEITSMEEGYDVVDDCCRKLWGRSIEDWCCPRLTGQSARLRELE